MARERIIKRWTLHRCLNDFPDLTPASLNNAFQVLERLASLGFNSAIDNSAGLGIEAEASGNEDKRRTHNSLAIWTNGLGCIYGTI
jgi:hypothetical protein